LAVIVCYGPLIIFVLIGDYYALFGVFFFQSLLCYLFLLQSTVFDMKRIIGRSYQDPVVQ